jgi:hypothetical protein
MKLFVGSAEPLEADAPISAAVAPESVLCNGTAGRESPVGKSELGDGSKSFAAIVGAAAKSCGRMAAGTVSMKLLLDGVEGGVAVNAAVAGELTLGWNVFAGRPIAGFEWRRSGETAAAVTGFPVDGAGGGAAVKVAVAKALPVD